MCALRTGTTCGSVRTELLAFGDASKPLSFILLAFHRQYCFPPFNCPHYGAPWAPWVRGGIERERSYLNILCGCIPIDSIILPPPPGTPSHGMSGSGYTPRCSRYASYQELLRAHRQRRFYLLSPWSPRGWLFKKRSILFEMRTLRRISEHSNPEARSGNTQWL